MSDLVDDLPRHGSPQLVLNGKRGCSRAGGGLEDRQHRIAHGVDDSAAVGDADRLERQERTFGGGYLAPRMRAAGSPRGSLHSASYEPTRGSTRTPGRIALVLRSERRQMKGARR